MKKLLVSFFVLSVLIISVCLAEYFGGTIIINSVTGAVTITNSLGVVGHATITDYLNIGHNIQINDLWAFDGQSTNLILNPSNQFGQIILVTNTQVTGSLSINAPTNGSLAFYSYDGVNLVRLSALQTNFFQISTNNSGEPFFVISSNKFVGILTNNPATPLHVKGGITMQKGGYGNGALMSDGGSYLYFDNTGFSVVNNSGGINFNVSNDGFGAAGYVAIANATISRHATGNAHLKVGDGSGANGTNGLFFGNTINTTATTGITMNRQTGRVKIASGSQTYLLTNNLATTSSAVIATVNTDDATAFACKAIPTAGLITLKLNGVAAADTEISFFITSP